MAQGVILAAGFASRAASNKLLFEVDGRSLIKHAIDGMKPWVSHIFVVTGHYDDAIGAHLGADPKVSCIFNADYALGMFSSIKKGVFMTHESFFVLPADCPFVSQKTYQTLLMAKDEMVVPSYKNRRGHPILIHQKYRELLLKEPVTSSLKAFRNRYPFQTIEVDDPNILIDLDTKADYDKLITKGGTVDGN